MKVPDSGTMVSFGTKSGTMKVPDSGTMKVPDSGTMVSLIAKLGFST